jgi:hypothetical protein
MAATARILVHDDFELEKWHSTRPQKIEFLSIMAATARILVHDGFELEKWYSTRPQKIEFSSIMAATARILAHDDNRGKILSRSTSDLKAIFHPHMVLPCSTAI